MLISLPRQNLKSNPMWRRLALRMDLFCALACCLLLIELSSCQTLANSATQTANNTLPALSERANGLNSRYLSAGSTASLAAATVAAANQAPQQQQQQTSIQHQSAHQHSQNQHPQQHQQQQVAPNNVGHPSQSQQQPPQQQNGLQNPAQYSTATSLPAASQALASPGINALANQVTPVMTSTYAFNPLTGQYGPAESAFVSNFQQQQQQQNLLNQPFISQQSSVNYQQPFFQQQQQPQSFYTPPPPPSLNNNNNNFLVGNSRSPQRVQNFYQANSNYLQQQQQQQQPFGRYPQQSAFTRRNGQQSLGLGSRNSNYLLGGAGGSGGGNQLIDDDSNGLFQQQQVSSGGGGSLADQLAASLGLNLDPSYGIGASQSNANGYLQDQLQAGNSFVQQPSSVAASLALPNGNQQQQQQQHHHSQHSSYNGNPLLASGEPQHRNDQCVAADGRHGTCYQASECIRRGGTPMGRCGAGQSSNSLTSELSGTSHVCCLFDVTCGQFAAERFVYFRNPNYPNTFDQPRMCRAKIGKLDKGVCQFRLDLTRFDIAKPTNGNCSHDMFVVSGQNENYVIPKICGLNDGQHYYVGVDESGVITLHMMLMGYYRRSFEILITQIPCRSDFAAPAHCLQYFMGTHGTIKSFNYDDELAAYGGGLSGQNQGAFVNYDLQQEGSAQQLSPFGSGGGGGGSPTAPYGLQFSPGSAPNQQLQQRQQPIFSTASQTSGRYGGQLDLSGGGGGNLFGGYPNDLDYTICIRKESGFCSITYQLSRTDQGLSPFAVGAGNGGPFGHNDSTNYGTATTAAWSSVSTECRDDYLLIGGVRLCSGGGGGGGGGGAGSQSALAYEQTVAFNQQQNSSNSFAIQQLQQQQNLLMQQLARLQQQQQQQAVLNTGQATNSSGILSGANQASNNQQQLVAGGGNVQSNSNGNGNNFVNGNNLDQQQAAIVQQLMISQQQLNNLMANGANGQSSQLSVNQFSANNRPAGTYQQDNQFGSADLQGAIITDTTSGPFLLRFVSNMARNARGFHIDYRQNPCK